MVYMLLRVAYGHFYDRFGLSPADLGVSYADLLTQSALLGIIGMIYLSALTVCLVMVGWTLARVSRSAPDPPGWRAPGSAAVLVATTVVLVMLSWPQRHLAGGAIVALLWLLFGAAAVYPVATVARARLRRWWTTPRVDADTPAEEKLGAGAIVAAAAAISAIVVGSSWLIASADHDADEVIDGRSLSASRWLGVRTTSWSAEAATLSWTANAVDPALRRLAHSCVMVLGQADGTLFVYTPHALDRTTFRLPAASAGVRVFPDRRCRTGSPIPSR